MDSVKTSQILTRTRCVVVGQQRIELPKRALVGHVLQFYDLAFPEQILIKFLPEKIRQNRWFCRVPHLRSRCVPAGARVPILTLK